LYYTCDGTGRCTGAKVPLASQVWNPVSKLPLDNNGFIVKLPAVDSSGALSVTGTVVFGIGTRGNNTPPATGIQVYPASGTTGTFSTWPSFWNSAGQGFLDTGSNGLFFYHPTLSHNSGGWYTPASLTDFTATNAGYKGTPSGTVSFQIGSITALQQGSANRVFSNIGGTALQSDGFDWGLPFFFGRDVYVGVEGKSSNLGAGPYWAY
jgi:hypothetical protein